MAALSRKPIGTLNARARPACLLHAQHLLDGLAGDADLAGDVGLGEASVDESADDVASLPVELLREPRVLKGLGAHFREATEGLSVIFGAGPIRHAPMMTTPGCRRQRRVVKRGADRELPALGVPMTLRLRDEQGSASIEAAIAVPAFGLFVGLIIFGGRMAMTHEAVQTAAADAARTASIARSTGEASRTAETAARESLANQGIDCRSTTVRIDSSGFSKPVGEPGTVTAVVECRLDLSDLSVPGIPGSRAVRATMSSPVDAYRERGTSR